jgi:hypothetical protein
MSSLPIESLLSMLDHDVSVIATPRRPTAPRRDDVSASDATDAATLGGFFDQPVRAVQQLFGMSEAAFTRAFRSAGIPRWPYRRVRALLSAAERASTSANDRIMLMHEYDFLLRNTELLGVSAASEKRASSRKTIPLPHTWCPLRAPISDASLAALENEMCAFKAVRRKKRTLPSSAARTSASTATVASKRRRRRTQNNTDDDDDDDEEEDEEVDDGDDDEQGEEEGENEEDDYGDATSSTTTAANMLVAKTKTS